MTDLPVNISDRLASFSITNYLYASLQGDFAFLNILGQFEHPAFNPADPATVQNLLQEVALWNSYGWEGSPLFVVNSNEPTTFEATRALELLAAQRGRTATLLEVARKITLPILQGAETAITVLDARLLLAILGKVHYARDNYIRGFIQFGENNSAEEIVARHTALLEDSSATIETVHDLITQIESLPNDGAVKPGELLNQLRFQTRDLVFTLSSHIHDISLLLAPFAGGLNFKTLAFSEDETQQWQDSGVDPATAGYWRAFGFKVAESSQWISAGHTEAQFANEWRWFGFSFSAASEWLKLKISPSLARRWANANYSAEEAQEMLEQGIKEPPAQG